MPTPAAVMVRGHAGVRRLLGVRWKTACELVRYDASKGTNVFTRSGRDRAIRASADDVMALFRAMCGERDGVVPPSVGK